MTRNVKAAVYGLNQYPTEVNCRCVVLYKIDEEVHEVIETLRFKLGKCCWRICVIL